MLLQAFELSCIEWKGLNSHTVKYPLYHMPHDLSLNFSRYVSITSSVNYQFFTWHHCMHKGNENFMRESFRYTQKELMTESLRFCTLHYTVLENNSFSWCIVWLFKYNIHNLLLEYKVAILQQFCAGERYAVRFTIRPSWDQTVRDSRLKSIEFRIVKMIYGLYLS